MRPFRYASAATPDDYKCDLCGRGDCKLWRQYQTFAGRTKLYCADCALADQGEKGPVDSAGKRETDSGRTDQIGWLVPAVPVEEGGAFWGYTSVPDDGVAWWKGLRT